MMRDFSGRINYRTEHHNLDFLLFNRILNDKRIDSKIWCKFNSKVCALFSIDCNSVLLYYSWNVKSINWFDQNLEYSAYDFAK